MNFEDRYLLACLAEECAEVQQEIMKIFRFGLHDVNPNGDGVDNITNLTTEVNDVEALIQMTRSKGLVKGAMPYFKKKDKVNKWLEYARDKDDGKLNDDDGWISGFSPGKGT